MPTNPIDPKGQKDQVFEGFVLAGLVRGGGGMKGWCSNVLVLCRIDGILVSMRNVYSDVAVEGRPSIRIESLIKPLPAWQQMPI